MKQIPSAALRSAGLVYRREFGVYPGDDTDDIVLGGNAYIDNTGLVVPATSVNDVGKLYTKGEVLLNDAFTISFKFVPRFTPDGVTRPLLYAITNSGFGANLSFLMFFQSSAFTIYLYTTGVVLGCSKSISFITPHWRLNQENTFVFSSTSGSQKTYINGVQFDSRASTYNFMGKRFYEMHLGNAHTDNGATSDLTIKSLEVYSKVVDPKDAVVLDAKTLAPGIELDRQTLHLPCVDKYVNGSAKTVTSIHGTHRENNSEAFLGSDGVTLAEFPEFVQRGADNYYNCYSATPVAITKILTIPDHSDFRFDGGDVPFSFAVDYEWIGNSTSGRIGIVTKGEAGTAYNHDWSLLQAGSQLLFRVHQSVSPVVYLTRYGNDLIQNYERNIIICTYDGSALSSGMKMYVNKARADTADSNVGVYVGIANTSQPIVIGKQWYNCQGLVRSFTYKHGVEWSPLQVQAITQILQERRVKGR